MELPYKLEYKVFWYGENTNCTSDELETKLNELAAKGWSIAGCMPNGWIILAKFEITQQI